LDFDGIVAGQDNNMIGKNSEETVKKRLGMPFSPFSGALMSSNHAGILLKRCP
jgi:hypothetical protein